jgi:hypothetical protein
MDDFSIVLMSYRRNLEREFQKKRARTLTNSFGPTWCIICRGVDTDCFS